jgi:hypothetical protein
VKLRLAEQAQQDIARIESFWAAQRPKNPLLFRQELNAALDVIEATPRLAASYTSERTGKLYYKVPLPKTRNVVYYECDEAQSVAYIVTIQSPFAGDEDP